MASWQFISWTFISHLCNRQNNCWKLKPNNPSHSCWDIQLATTTTNLILTLKEQSPCTNFHGNLPDTCWDISVWNQSAELTALLALIKILSWQLSVWLKARKHRFFSPCFPFFLSGAYFTRWFPAPWPEASPAAKCLPAPFTLIFPVVSGRSWLQQCKVPHRQKG